MAQVSELTVNQVASLTEVAVQHFISCNSNSTEDLVLAFAFARWCLEQLNSYILVNGVTQFEIWPSWIEHLKMSGFKDWQEENSNINNQL